MEQQPGPHKASGSRGPPSRRGGGRDGPWHHRSRGGDDTATGLGVPSTASSLCLPISGANSALSPPGPLSSPPQTRVVTVTQCRGETAGRGTRTCRGCQHFGGLLASDCRSLPSTCPPAHVPSIHTDDPRGPLQTRIPPPHIPPSRPLCPLCPHPKGHRHRVRGQRGAGRDGQGGGWKPTRAPAAPRSRPPSAPTLLPASREGGILFFCHYLPVMSQIMGTAIGGAGQYFMRDGMAGTGP